MKIIKISKKSIEQIASELRNELTIDPDDDQITAMCLQVSRELKKRLISNGYEAIVVQGVFEVDSPDVAYSEMDSDLYVKIGFDFIKVIWLKKEAVLCKKCIVLFV
jgi:hypothetical protein